MTTDVKVKAERSRRGWKAPVGTVVGVLVLAISITWATSRCAR